MINTSVTSHRVEIHKEDLAGWFTENVGDADLEGIFVFTDDSGTFHIALPVSVQYLDAILREKISGLPEWGQYQLQVLPYAQDVVGVITWNE